MFLTRDKITICTNTSTWEVFFKYWYFSRMEMENLTTMSLWRWCCSINNNVLLISIRYKFKSFEVFDSFTDICTTRNKIYVSYTTSTISFSVSPMQYILLMTMIWLSQYINNVTLCISESRCRISHFTPTEGGGMRESKWE